MATLLGLCVALVGLEVGLRLVGRFHPLVTNLEGAPESGASRRGLRILCAGDSFTAGIGASGPEQTYPAQLRSLLNHTTNPAHPIQVYPLGIVGANSTVVRTALQEALPVVDPDVVVLLAGGTNNVNYVGYASFLERSSFAVRLDSFLNRVRVIRLLESLGARSRERPESAAGLMAADTGPCPNARLYRRWHEKARPGVPLPPAFDVGMGWIESGDLEQALSAFQRGLLADPESVPLLFGLGLVHRLRLERDAAWQAYQRGLSLDPDNPVLYYAMAEIFIDNLQPGDQASRDQAMHWLEEGLERVPQAAILYCGMGVFVWHSGAYRKSLEWHEKGIALDPNEARCYVDLPALTRVLDNREEVVEYLAQYEDVSPVARSFRRLLSSSSMEADIDRWVKADIARAVELVRAQGATVVLQTYPDDIVTNSRLRWVARSRGCALVDHEPVFRKFMDAGVPRYALLLPDRHCTDLGYAIMASNVASRLADMGIVPPSSKYDPMRLVASWGQSR